MLRHESKKESHARMKATQLTCCRNPLLADVVEQNITTLLEIRREFQASRTLQDRFADGITEFSGSMAFLYVHLVWFAVWIAANQGWLGVRPFDPFPFGLLTMIVSLEAIFLSTFVLISQNRMALVADQRANLDLQINLLAEHEITRILTLVDAIADHLGIEAAKNPELGELKADVSPGIILAEIQDRQREWQE